MFEWWIEDKGDKERPQSRRAAYVFLIEVQHLIAECSHMRYKKNRLHSADLFLPQVTELYLLPTAMSVHVQVGGTGMIGVLTDVVFCQPANGNQVVPEFFSTPTRGFSSELRKRSDG